MKQFAVGFIGVGNMASAILGGVLEKGLYTPEEIGLFDISPPQMERFTQKGATALDNIPDLVTQSHLVVLAIKPQQFEQIMPLVRDGLTSDTIVVSIAAGITAAYLERHLGGEAKIVLAMPNTPLLVGQGATVLARVSPTTEEEFEQAKALFASAGLVEEIQPEKMTDSIPIHGSSPAFLYEFARIIGDCAESVGISKETAIRLFSQTMVGTGTMLLESGKSPQELIDMVCSPGGTTLAGMKALQDADFQQTIENTFSATIWRGKELAGTVPHHEEITVIPVVYGSPEYDAELELRRQVLREPLGMEILESDIETDRGAIHLAAMGEGAVVGTCQLVPLDAFIARLGQVVVDPSWQGEGIGTLLLYHAEQTARARGFSRLTVESRETAKNFYMRQGFLARGSEFLKHGIPHIPMYKELD